MPGTFLLIRTRPFSIMYISEPASSSLKMTVPASTDRATLRAATFASWVLLRPSKSLTFLSRPTSMPTVYHASEPRALSR